MRIHCLISLAHSILNKVKMSRAKEIGSVVSAGERRFKILKNTFIFVPPDSIKVDETVTTG